MKAAILPENPLKVPHDFEVVGIDRFHREHLLAGAGVGPFCSKDLNIEVFIVKFRTIYFLYLWYDYEHGQDEGDG